jgi:putative tryptophan/tyrosine transport system substrate-binding protein
MIRREFITLLGGSAVAWPIAARAQQAGKLPTIGFLGASAASVQSQHVAAFVQRLRELGWIDGHTVGVEVRWAHKPQPQPWLPVRRRRNSDRVHG